VPSKWQQLSRELESGPLAEPAGVWVTRACARRACDQEFTAANPARIYCSPACRHFEQLRRARERAGGRRRRARR
jgi:hypothetical protein